MIKKKHENGLRWRYSFSNFPGYNIFSLIWKESWCPSSWWLNTTQYIVIEKWKKDSDAKASWNNSVFPPYRCPLCGLTSTQVCLTLSGWRNAVSLQLPEKHCKRSFSTTVSRAPPLYIHTVIEYRQLVCAHSLTCIVPRTLLWNILSAKTTRFPQPEPSG